MLRGDGRWVLGLDLSPDGRRLAFIDIEGKVRVVDTATRRVVAGPAQVDQFSFFGSGLEMLRFSPDGSRLAVGGGWGTILDAATLRLIAHLAAPVEVDRLAFSPTAGPWWPACCGRREAAPACSRSTPATDARWPRRATSATGPSR